jgi:micrococcal nuclease
MSLKKIATYTFTLAVLLATANAVFAHTVCGKVVSVADGDTLTIVSENRPYKLRLADIDCPESKQRFGEEAKQITVQLASDRQVTASWSRRDRYERLIAEVTLPDGTILNSRLVETGYAWWYPKYSNNQDLGQKENQARLLKLGVWSKNPPEAPWEFRARSRARQSRIYDILSQ